MKWPRRITIILGAGLLITIGTIAERGVVYEHESRWNPTISKALSNYRPVSVWGAPLHIIVDGPPGQENSNIDIGDSFKAPALLGNWVFWSLLTMLVYGVGLSLWIVVTQLIHVIRLMRGRG